MRLFYYILIIIVSVCANAGCDGHSDDDDNDAADDDMIVDDDSAPDDDLLTDDDAAPDDDTQDDDSFDDDTDDDDTLDDDDDTIFAPQDVHVWASGKSKRDGVILHYYAGEVSVEQTPAGLDTIDKISLASPTHGLAASFLDLLVYDGASWRNATEFPAAPADPLFRDVLSTPSVDWVLAEGYSDFLPYLYRNTGSGWELTDTSALPEGTVNKLSFDGQRFWVLGHIGFLPTITFTAYYDPASGSWVPASVVGSGDSHMLLDIDYYASDFAMAAGIFMDPPFSYAALFGYNGEQWELMSVPEQVLPASTEGLNAVSLYGDQCAYLAGLKSLPFGVLSAFMIKYDHGTWNTVPEISFNGRIQKIRAMADGEYWYVGYYYDANYMYADYGVFRYCLNGECHTLLTAGQMNALEQLDDLVVLPVAD
ncbi:MAG TPA: hypothetical protein PKW95_03150 [bacterium]|nr:hypothetical protein [bacterium]